MDGEWFEEQEQVLSNINITPLVDVALVLLLIFMITAPLMVQGADVRLPRTQPMDRLPPNAVFVDATVEEQVLLDGILVPLDELAERLARVAVPGQSGYLRADERLPYAFILQLIAAMKEAELNVALVTQPEVERIP